MKKTLLKIITLIALVPIISFYGCSSKKSKLSDINLVTYYNEKVVCTSYNSTKSYNLKISDLTRSKPNKLLADQYIKFELSANSAWMYKMYIDYIYFKVYTNIATQSAMTINLKMTNLADESDLSNPTDDFTADASLIPEKDGSINCWFKINKVVPTATGTKLTIDILDTTEVFADEFGKDNGFKWIIYDLKFYAESRTYS